MKKNAVFIDDVIVVTGGAGKLGAEFCKKISESGAVCVIADIRYDEAKKIERQILDAGFNCLAAQLDILNPVSVKKLIEDLDKRYGRIDAVVNNAYPRFGKYGAALEKVDFEDFCKNIIAHIGGYFLVSQQFGMYFKAHGGGNIVNIASIYGVEAPRFELYQDTEMTMPVEYAAAKSGIVHMTKYFSQYYKKFKVRANAIAPGGILAGQPSDFVGRYNAQCGAKGMLDPEDITGTLLYLLSSSSRHVTGQTIVVDDGWSGG